MTTITIERGATLALDLVGKVGATETDLPDGSEFAAILRTYPQTSRVIADLAPTITDGVGRIELETEDVPAGSYVFDLIYKESDNLPVWSEKYILIITEPVTPVTYLS